MVTGELWNSFVLRVRTQTSVVYAPLRLYDTIARYLYIVKSWWKWLGFICCLSFFFHLRTVRHTTTACCGEFPNPPGANERSGKKVTYTLLQRVYQHASETAKYSRDTGYTCVRGKLDKCAKALLQEYLARGLFVHTACEHVALPGDCHSSSFVFCFLPIPRSRRRRKS